MREGGVVGIDDPGAVIDLAGLRKILVVKLDFIGDWVLTTPFLAGLRRSAPQAEITAVVLDRVYDLAAPCRFVDRVVAVAPADHGPVRFAAATAADLDAFLGDYASGAFHLALVPRWDSDFNGALRLAGLSGAARVVGFSEECTERKRSDNRGDDRFYSTAFVDRDDAHEVEHMIGLLEAIGGRADTDAVAIDLCAEDWRAADAFAGTHFGGAARPLLAVAPFAAGRKQLPLERTADLARRFAARFGLAVAVIGSPEHGEAGEAFARMVGPGAVSAAGRLGLRQGAALIGRAALLLGMDSSPGHIAAALGTPAAIVFGNHAGGSPRHVGAPERFRPWCDPALIHLIRPAAPLSPCVEGCDADQPHCILQVETDVVLPALADFLAGTLLRRARRGALPMLASANRESVP